MATLGNPSDAAEFLKDLLSEAELLMLARRLQIAELLIEGLTYEQIRKEIKVSFGTIARVQTWLTLYGEGYRKILKRIAKKGKNSAGLSSFDKVKRKYPMYYWPELLLDEIVKSANKREKNRLQKIVEQLKDKTKLSRQLSSLLVKE